MLLYYVARRRVHTKYESTEDSSITKGKQAFHPFGVGVLISDFSLPGKDDTPNCLLLATVTVMFKLHNVQRPSSIYILHKKSS